MYNSIPNVQTKRLLPLQLFDGAENVEKSRKSNTQVLFYGNLCIFLHSDNVHFVL